MKLAVETYANQLKEVDIRVGSEGRNQAVVAPRWSSAALRWLRRFSGMGLELLQLFSLPADVEATAIVSEFASYESKKLKIKFPYESINNQCLNIPFCITELELVVMSAPNTIILLGNLVNITKLHLRSPFVDAEAIYDLELPASLHPQSLARLETLHLSSLYLHGPNDATPSFLTPASKLRSLFLHRGKLPDAFYIEVGSKMTTIETVSLRGCDLSTSVLTHLPSSTLQSLSIISCTNIQSEVIPYLMLCPKLERLDIGLTFVDQQIFNPPGLFSSLKHVRFGPLETAQNGAIIPVQQPAQNVVVFTFGSIALLDRHFPELETLQLMSKVWVVFPTLGAEGSPSVLFRNLTSLKMMDVMDGACIAGFLAYCPQLARVECTILAGDVLLSSKSLQFFAMRSGDAFVQVRHCPRLLEIQVAQLRNLNLVGPCEELTTLRIANLVTSWAPHSASLLALSASFSSLPKLTRIHLSALGAFVPLQDLGNALGIWLVALGKRSNGGVDEDFAFNAVSLFVEHHFIPAINSWLANPPTANSPSAVDLNLLEDIPLSDQIGLLMSSNIPLPTEAKQWFEWRMSPVTDPSSSDGSLFYRRSRVAFSLSQHMLRAKIEQVLANSPSPRPIGQSDTSRCLLVSYEQVV